MNILHMKYAVEVARQGSLNKAAESLLIAQPNISRSIKELESDLGVVLFTRSAKGMFLTPEGEEFIAYAKNILRQIDEVDLLYKKGTHKKQRFSVSVPRADYISEAMADFTCAMDVTPYELTYREDSMRDTIQHVLDGDCKMGIIRYDSRSDRTVKTLLEDKALQYELVAEFTYALLMSKEHPLATKDPVFRADLAPYIEIACDDGYLSGLSPATSSGEDEPRATRRVFVRDRATQFGLLAENHEAFMWVSPSSKRVLDGYELVQKTCTDEQSVYKDVLIYREDYRLTRADKLFITALCDAKRRLFR